MVHPAWLPEETFEFLRGRHVSCPAMDSPIRASILGEVIRAGAIVNHYSEVTDFILPDNDLALAFDETLPVEGYQLQPAPHGIILTGADERGLLYGFFYLARLAATGGLDHTDRLRLTDGLATCSPAIPIRMLDHWDNVDIHPVMGQVERGYAGSSLFFDDGELRWDLSRTDEYARLLASVGINTVAINNVNVHATETTLLTERLDCVVRLAEHFRAWGITTCLSVNFAAPMVIGGLDTCDPVDPRVEAWWAEKTDAVYDAIPDFGGFVVKADSEDQPGPFAYGRTHADGANMLARVLAPHGGVVHWRCFVYNHRQDWRDRTTDRAKAAYDHFTPLDGDFEDNVILQVKHGPLDFQVREAVSPLLAAMDSTRLSLEVQITGEYTGQQRHVFFLPEMWTEVLDFHPWGDETPLWAIMAGEGPGARSGGMVAVSNVGMDEFWTGHPFAQANLYGFGRLAWDPELSPTQILDEWIPLTFPHPDPRLVAGLTAIISGSRAVYESYTAPLGVCFMVNPGHHYGPSVDGYEYTPWGTYHFADRDGIGVDRTRTTGSGYTGQYHEPWAATYESVETCPEELLLFFHHVRWDYQMRDGRSIAQHIYDTHFEGAEATTRMREVWASMAGLVDEPTYRRVVERLDEQCRSAAEWRDQLTTYVWRHSGIPDRLGRPLY